jgi:hypothetical protein
MWERKQIQFPKRRIFQYLEFRTMDEVHKRSDSECYKPPSEAFSFQLVLSVSSRSMTESTVEWFLNAESLSENWDFFVQ